MKYLELCLNKRFIPRRAERVYSLEKCSYRDWPVVYHLFPLLIQASHGICPILFQHSSFYLSRQTWMSGCTLVYNSLQLPHQLSISQNIQAISTHSTWYDNIWCSDTYGTGCISCHFSYHDIVNRMTLQDNVTLLDPFTYTLYDSDKIKAQDFFPVIYCICKGV